MSAIRTTVVCCGAELELALEKWVYCPRCGTRHMLQLIITAEAITGYCPQGHPQYARPGAPVPCFACQWATSSRDVHPEAER